MIAVCSKLKRHVYLKVAEWKMNNLDKEFRKPVIPSLFGLYSTVLLHFAVYDK